MLNAEAKTERSIEVVFKILDACNNKCKYCFYFGHKDRNFDDRSKYVINRETIVRVADFLKTGCNLLGINGMSIIIHGGEPLLQPIEDFDCMCQYLQSTVGEVAKVTLGVQTNGTLISKDWIEVFKKYKIVPSISIDGFEECHNKFRVDYKGEGTYEQVVNGITLLTTDGNERLKKFGTLSVINPAYSAKKIYRHFVDDLGCRNMDFLLPDMNHDTLNEYLDMFNVTMDDFGDFLCDLFDEWVADDDPKIEIRLFKELLLLLLGDKYSVLGDFGPCPREGVLPVVTIFRNGSLSVEDNLVSTRKGILDINANIENTTLADFIKKPLFAELRRVRSNLPNTCERCVWAKICNGGATINRYSSKNDFDNPSVYCLVLKRLYARMASYLVNRGIDAGALPLNISQ